ncbi:Calcineurin-like phosphoesterase domain, ApaH type,Metallo-dependent phosphatase-like [Cinara cedri]|uniref:Calcineurin-like phosphoesterase domain, ApaH type,Metallo-dependent phosphatase-like n=1 Tax=Cinara cedri TaxID=506608 RepID=A0A5E4MPW4_9HEMI|nr:Calcineurin-like phosphoesterase domain, ApaH type,Metallo-dependent phosphatase-like [Cinara cedri]
MNFTSRLIWFLQISDLHLSIFHDWKRVTELKEFCELTLDTIKPAAVLVSGDLTDAKKKNGIGSTQYEGEWLAYHNVLTSKKVSEKTKWLDIRGNHDSFDVKNLDSPNNFYRKYSKQGQSHPRSYKYKVTNDAGMSLNFIAIDACLDPGPKRPFNFIGNLDDDEIFQLNYLANNTNDPIVWFGHYPTSCIFTAGSKTVRSIIGDNPMSIAYLCGHLHTLGGLVPHMYTIQDEGFAELELGDWKDERMFRLLAFDHGSFTFIDIRHGQWPIILVTYPKIPWLTIRNMETDENLKTNNKYIRILAFSIDPIKHVLVQIDEEYKWVNCSNIEGSPLYVTEWDSNRYSRGLHVINVKVEDIQGRIHEVSQAFSLDNSKPTLKLFSQWPLNVYFPDVLFMMFVIASLANLLPLIVYRFVSKCTKYRVNYNTKSSLIDRYSRKMILLSSVNRVFYPLLLFYVYLCIGPWAVGELVTDLLGWVFPWGIYIKGRLVKDSFIYAYGFGQIVTFQLPLNCILCDRLNKKMQILPNMQYTFFTSPYIYIDMIFFILIIWQIVCCLWFFGAYGWIATIFGPLKTWSIFIALWLWNEIRKISINELRCATGAMEKLNQN